MLEKTQQIFIFFITLAVSTIATAGLCTCLSDGRAVNRACKDSAFDCADHCRSYSPQGTFSYGSGHCAIYNPGVVLFEHENYRGDYLELSGQILDLTHDRYKDWNDKASSLQVKPGCTVTLYEHISYSGKQFSTSTDLTSLLGKPVGNDQISSVIVSCN